VRAHRPNQQGAALWPLQLQAETAPLASTAAITMQPSKPRAMRAQVNW